MTIKPWQLIGSQPCGDFRIFKIRSDKKISPRTRKEHEFYVLDCVDWVNVLPVTPDNHLVMVEQFRHGTNTVELELPGGMMDRGDASPVVTALRELQEETGYEGDPATAEVIGKIFPNPAIMSNTAHTVLVRHCECRHDTMFDTGEDLVTRLVPISELPQLVCEGRIRHSLIVVALYHFQLWRERHPQALKS